MSDQKLVKDKWYRFSPYKNQLEKVWYMKSLGEGTRSGPYIGIYQGSSMEPHYSKGAGSFGWYDHPEGKFQEVTHPQLLNWLEECVKENRYIPKPDITKEEIINNYQIY